MARGGRKGPANMTASHQRETSLLVAAPTPALMPAEENRAPEDREGVSIPRSTTDNLWRDLHPTRIWPD